MEDKANVKYKHLLVKCYPDISHIFGGNIKTIEYKYNSTFLVLLPLMVKMSTEQFSFFFNLQYGITGGRMSGKNYKI